ncbi:MAG: hypothetical protein Q7J08_01715 [Methanocorpusculum sp.]|uniref:hypothetical protein n=1 Tax=Methanocorpusculum sp. TaxID=2058474 RepID=UPI00271DCF37|nr:hypothetical protein [Methanocorpusculum sp.]MDO9522409.1 hypothetical protein [Methanocorpusculum sp.]
MVLPEAFWTILFLLIAGGIVLLFLWAVKRNLRGEACSCGAKACKNCSLCKNNER